MKKLLEIIFEIVFVLVVWIALILIAVTWPLIFIYIFLISPKPASDYISEAAQGLIATNNLFDKICGRVR